METRPVQPQIEYAFTPQEWEGKLGEAAVIPEDQALQSLNDLVHQHSADVMEPLTVTERKVLKLRFGLTDGRSRSVRQAAAELGMPKSTVFDTEHRALKRLIGTKPNNPTLREYL